MGKGQILSLGGTWDRSRISERYRFTSEDTGGLSGFVAADQFVGIDDKLMAYTTFQQPIGSWTVMPGLRIERDNRRITSPGHPEVTIDRTDIFPTLHIDHALSKALNLTISYSQRIDRPQLNELRPYAIVEDVVNAKQGNPHLRNQSTDAYEINLHYHRGKLDAGVLVYDRETSDLWSTAYTVVNGINVFRQVNAGHSRDTGAQIDLGTPIVGRFKISASVNLFDQRIPVDAVEGARFDGIPLHHQHHARMGRPRPGRPARRRRAAPVDVQQPVPELRPALCLLELAEPVVHAQLQPDLLCDRHGESYQSLNRHRLDAPLVQEDYAVRRPMEFKLKLLKTFGKR